MGEGDSGLLLFEPDEFSFACFFVPPLPPPPPLRRCRRATSKGVAVVAGEVALRYASADALRRLGELLAAARRRARGVPADWCVCARAADAKAASGRATPGVNCDGVTLDALLASESEDGDDGAPAADERLLRGQRLGLCGDEAREVADAVALAWARRRWLRLVIVLVPSAAAVDGAGKKAAAVLGRPPPMRPEDAAHALRVVRDAARHGAVVAGTAEAAVELLRRALEDV